jgi:hypothetical protein
VIEEPSEPAEEAPAGEAPTEDEAEPEAPAQEQAEPEAELDSDVEDVSDEEAPAAPVDEAADAAVEEHAPASDAEGQSGSSVDDLFARLRSGDSTDGDGEVTIDVEVVDVDTVAVAKDEVLEVVADPGADAAPEDATEEEETAAGPPPAEDDSPTPFSERDALLEPVDKELARRLKRALADEQNEVLDLLRRAKPKSVDDVLPDPAAHAARWSEVVVATLGDAAGAGATWAGGKAGAVTDIADDLARSLTAPLRDRIDRSFAAADGNLDDIADRVRALYREWKGQRLIETSRHYTAAAYAQGVFDATRKGASVHWVVDPFGGRCPDCDDNVLGGELEKGIEFPTGHTCAPAHPGCRCLVLAVDR